MTLLPGGAPSAEARRQLPAGEEIFLDHVAHFVRDAEAAGRALRRVGFAPTPVSIQADKDPSTGKLVPTGTGNITAMFPRGYTEVLFKNSDSPLAEAGVPGFDAAAWQGVIAPAHTPPAIVGKLNAALNAAVAMPDVRLRMREIGMIPVGAGSPAELQEFLQSEIVRWGKVVEDAGIAHSE